MAGMLLAGCAALSGRHAPVPAPGPAEAAVAADGLSVTGS
jgi:hypothetical protein